MAAMKTFTLFRHYTGTRYHGRVMELEAEDSDDAIKRVGEVLALGNHRPLLPDELFILQVEGTRGALHIFRAEPQPPTFHRVA